MFFLSEPFFEASSPGLIECSWSALSEATGWALGPLCKAEAWGARADQLSWGRPVQNGAVPCGVRPHTPPESSTMPCSPCWPGCIWKQRKWGSNVKALIKSHFMGITPEKLIVNKVFHWSFSSSCFLRFAQMSFKKLGEIFACHPNRVGHHFSPCPLQIMTDELAVFPNDSAFSAA